MNAGGFPELGFYTLPGHVDNPSAIVDEVSIADALGIGSVWISERMGSKDIGVLSGIALARSSRMGIASGLIANLTLRHPAAIASYAATMMKLSRNRFALGIGRGIDALSDAAGVPRLNFALLQDYIQVLRRFWRGEAVDYDGPLGRIRKLTIGANLEPRPPIIMAAMGPKTAHWAGRFCDGVLLDSLWSKEAVAESVRQVRQGARDAGRDPASVRVWTILVTACETTEEVMLQTVIRRMNTYVLFPKQFDVICEANGWDKAVAVRIREAVVRTSNPVARGSAGDEHASRDLEQLREVRRLYPEQWIQGGCAVGNADECAKTALERFDAGADGVLFHGSSPENLTSLLRAWPRYRPADRFAGRSVNPGL